MAESLRQRIARKLQAGELPVKTDAEIERLQAVIADMGQALAASYGAPIRDQIEKAIAHTVSTPTQLSWLPTDTTRTSIFSPIADQDLAQHHDKIVFESAWGRLTIHGPALTITDEGVLLAVLHLVMLQQSPVVRVAYATICKLLGLTYQTRNIRRIKAAIKKLALTSLEFELRTGTWSIERILRGAQGTADYSWVEIDTWFFQKFLLHEITTLDLAFRQSLRGDVAKALYRFLRSHRGPQSYRVDTLITALNMSQNRPLKKNRDALKRAFAELKRRNFCSYRYKSDVFSNIKIQGNIDITS